MSWSAFAKALHDTSSPGKPMERKRDFDTWLRRQVLLLDEDKGRCRKIVVRHVESGKTGSEVCTVKVPKSGEVGEEFLTAAGDEIESAIHVDAGGLQGVQTYVVQCYYTNQPDRASGRFTIREKGGEEEEEGSDVVSEPPTKSGLLTQMMRHNEAIMRTSMMGVGQVIASLRHSNARQAETIEKLMADRLESFATLEALKSEENERRIAVTEAEGRQKLLSDGFEKIAALVPVVINKIKGGKVIPGAPSPMEAMTKGLIETITPEQMENLQKIFSPHQLMILFEIFTSIQGSEKEQEEKTDAPPSGSR